MSSSALRVSSALKVIQCIGGYHQGIRRISSVHWGDIISALESVQCKRGGGCDIMSAWEDIMICGRGGFHQSIGWCSVHCAAIMGTFGDIMICV